ncbi:hypothetical protein Tco_0580217 [Tanacetum coccineum]
MKVFSNMRRITKGFSGQVVDLFPNMLDAAASSPSPSKITSSPSPTPSIFTLHLKPSPTLTITPHPSPFTTSTITAWIGILEADLSKTKKIYSSAYTKLILRVKKLESQIKVGEFMSNKHEMKLFIQEVTPTEIIHEQEGSGKVSDEISTAVEGKIMLVRYLDMKTEHQEKSPEEIEQDRLSYAEALRLEEQIRTRSKELNLLEIGRGLQDQLVSRGTRKMAMLKLRLQSKVIDWNDPLLFDIFFKYEAKSHCQVEGT